MLPIPKKFFLTASAAEGKTCLNAMDNALLAAGIGNINLIRVSSVIPPGAEYAPRLVIPAGSLVPTAYGYIISEIPGEIIAAAIGVGLSAETFGMIMEFAGRCRCEDARRTVELMVKEAFAARSLELVDLKVASIEHRVDRIGCALAAVPLWY